MIRISSDENCAGNIFGFLWDAGSENLLKSAVFSARLPLKGSWQSSNLLFSTKSKNYCVSLTC